MRKQTRRQLAKCLRLQTDEEDGTDSTGFLLERCRERLLHPDGTCSATALTFAWPDAAGAHLTPVGCIISHQLLSVCLSVCLSVDVLIHQVASDRFRIPSAGSLGVSSSLLLADFILYKRSRK